MARARPESSVRSYRSGDRDSFLDLYERVWGRERSTEWFDWRFDANPFRDGVEMVVAERDGQLIGAEPLLPFRLRVDGVELRAFQPADWIVDPDYQQQGVFTRMTERVFELYADEAALLFNFPSDALLPGLTNFDWRVVGTLPVAYRFNQPSAALADRSSPSRATRAMFRLGDTFSRPFFRMLDGLAWPRAGITVSCTSGVPAAITDLYAEAPPDGFHVPRDDAFCEWRFSNPRWETRTYLARRAGREVAAVVASVEEQASGLRVLRVLDVQPMTERPGRSSALAAIFDELVRNAGDVDAIRTPASPLSGALRRGFFRDDAVGVSRVAHSTTQVVRPLTTADNPNWRVAGRSLTDPENWTLALADQDVA